MKLFKQSSIVITLTLSLFASGSYLVASEMNKKQIIETARNTATYVRDVGVWASQYGTIYTTDYKSTHLAEKKVAEFIPENFSKPFTEEDMKTLSFFSKNPALIQREFADVVAKSDNTVKFRLTAENYMNPSNKPTSWEFNTIQTIKSKRLDEYGEFRDGYYLYAKTIYMKATCLKCHGEPETAPEGVTKQYGTINGFGFREGDVSGIISVMVPAKSKFEIFSFLQTPYGFIAALFFLLSIFLPLFYIYRTFIKPINHELNIIKLLCEGKVLKDSLQTPTSQTDSEMSQLRQAVSDLIKRYIRKPTKID